MDLIKCEICDQRILKLDITDHLKRCIYNIGYGLYERLSFVKTYLGDKELITYINGLSEGELEDFFTPIEFNVTPISYPIYTIVDSLCNGLKSNDPEFYNNTIQLLWSFFSELTRVFKKHNVIYIDYYLPSLLEVFNEVYRQGLENKLEDDGQSLKESFERVVHKYKDIVKYCYYELGGTEHWGSKIYFLEDANFFSEELNKRLTEYGLETYDILAKSSLTEDLIREIIIANLQNKEIIQIFPQIRDLLKYESSFFYDFKIELSDFLEYIIDTKEANSIRQVPTIHLDIEMDNTVEKIGRKENLVFNRQKHVIYFQRNGLWGLYPKVLEVFPESILDLTHLQKLDLSRNKINNIPESIDKLSELETLLLTKNEITILPENIGNLGNLKDLHIGQNNLSSLPTSIAKLKSLKILSLNSNKLKSLAKSIEKLPKLKHIYLENNYFKKFPEVLTNIHSLVMISLSNNDLQTIPESILNLKSLKSLFVKNTKIKIIPEFLKESNSLRIIM